ncbi:MAG: hypothetical protein ACI9TY_000837 [Alphaproteobacteria bacterium]
MIEPADSEYELLHAIIASPYIIDDDKKWKLINVENGQTISVSMGDEQFKNGVLNGKYPLKKSENDDYIYVLIEKKYEYKNGTLRLKETIANDVYTFNDEELEAIPENLRFNVKSNKKRSMQLNLIDNI